MTPSEERTQLAAAAIARETSMNGVLRRLSDELVGLFEGSAAAVSRVIGDLLVEVAQSTSGYLPAQARYDFLLSDYPLTEEVIDRREPRRVWLGDEDVDPSEADLLRQLGFEALLMLPLVRAKECWGLVEVYRDLPFDEEDARAAERLAAGAGHVFESLPADKA